jgi:hypothetical protein
MDWDSFDIKDILLELFDIELQYLFQIYFEVGFIEPLNSLTHDESKL